MDKSELQRRLFHLKLGHSYKLSSDALRYKRHSIASYPSVTTLSLLLQTHQYETGKITKYLIIYLIESIIVLLLKVRYRRFVGRRCRCSQLLLW